MATSTPALDGTLGGAPRVIWPTWVLADTLDPWLVRDQYGLAGAIQLTGTFAATTVVLQGSIDGTNYFQLKDLSNSNISWTAAGLFEFTTSCTHLKLVATGGAASAMVARTTAFVVGR